jgi:hypothetical protein
MPFLMSEKAMLGRLKERMIDWMNQQGQVTDWTIDGPDREAIDFNYEYEVIPSIPEVPMRIFLKQIEVSVAPSQSWINVSDSLAKGLKLPSGTLFRILPVAGQVDNPDPDDFSYDITWEDEKQYWYDIIYDPAKDRNDRARQVLMVDSAGHADTFVIPQNADAQRVATLWRRVIDAPDDVEVSVNTGNGEIFHWGLVATKEACSDSICTPLKRRDVSIYPGKTQFEAEQINCLLELKLPPLVRSHKTIRSRSEATLQFDEEPTPLGLKIIASHIFSWNLEGAILRDTQPMELWVPSDHNAIMRRGHSLNTSIQEDPADEIFPDLPWREEVTIRIKSQKLPPVVPIPIPAHDPPKPFTPREAGKDQHWARLPQSVPTMRHFLVTLPRTQVKTVPPSAISHRIPTSSV